MDIDPLGRRTSSNDYFTLDDIPTSLWRERIQIFYSWLQRQMAQPDANLERFLYIFALRFIGTFLDYLLVNIANWNFSTVAPLQKPLEEFIANSLDKVKTSLKRQGSSISK